MLIGHPLIPAISDPITYASLSKLGLGESGRSKKPVRTLLHHQQPLAKSSSFEQVANHVQILSLVQPLEPKISALVDTIIMEPNVSPTVPLNRLLNRLEGTIYSPENETKLRASQYERNRVGANIEHARALLLTLEKQSSMVRVQSERQQLQADLEQKRTLIKKLNTRLRELNQSDDEDGSEDGDEDDDEDILNTYAPARKDTEDGLEVGEPQGLRIDETQQQELRSRRPLQASDNRAAASTSAREQLFSNRSKQEDASLQQTETLMSNNRMEQETLTTGLLSLAQALKESSLNFSSSLESEKDVLKRAEGGLDKSSQGMEAAERKMSMLRRMSEGQGWWGRIKLYGFIFGLWVACFLLVFIGPKLRF